MVSLATKKKKFIKANNKICNQAYKKNKKSHNNNLKIRYERMNITKTIS
jgi:hypothetical protein